MGNGRSHRSAWSLRQAWCTNSESPETPRIWQSRFGELVIQLAEGGDPRSTGRRLKSFGQKNTQRHLPS